MKILLKVLIVILILNQSCKNGIHELNQFSSSNDTLIIKTFKHKGSGLFSLGVYFGYFEDPDSGFSYPVILPENIIDIERLQMITDIRSDTSFYIDIIKGRIGEEQVFIVDQNNNNDLTDDSIRFCGPIEWNSEDQLIECKFSISKYGKIVEDTSWLRIGLSYGGLNYGKSQHLIAEFMIDNEKFQVGIVAPWISDFTYNVDPEVALITHNSIMVDSLNYRDILIQGEVLKLNNNYYRFDNISYFGDSLTLVKENEFDKLIGVQVGNIAPDFNCITVSGDTINSTSLHDRILIIANSCDCGGDIQSTEAYYEILNKYGDKIHILRLDSKIGKNIIGNHIDMENEFNKDIYNKYRNAFCSRTCYVVDRTNRIIDKFPVKEWNNYLPKLIY